MKCTYWLHVGHICSKYGTKTGFSFLGNTWIFKWKSETVGKGVGGILRRQSNVYSGCLQVWHILLAFSVLVEKQVTLSVKGEATWRCLCLEVPTTFEFCPKNNPEGKLPNNSLVRGFLVSEQLMKMKHTEKKGKHASVLRTKEHSTV